MLLGVMYHDFDDKDALIVRGCLCDPALPLEHHPYEDQSERDIMMLLGAMYLESDGKAALIVRDCLCEHALIRCVEVLR